MNESYRPNECVPHSPRKVAATRLVEQYGLYGYPRITALLRVEG